MYVIQEKLISWVVNFTLNFSQKSDITLILLHFVQCFKNLIELQFCFDILICWYGFKSVNPFLVVLKNSNFNVIAKNYM